MLTLLQKIYGSNEVDACRIFRELLISSTSELDVKTVFLGKNVRNWIQVDVSGLESKVVEAYLDKQFGVAPSFSDIHVPLVVKGKIVDSGRVGYGIYVDIGLSLESPLDVLVPLYKFRSHLIDGQKLSMRKIIDIFCLYDNLPLSIRLININEDKQQIWAEPSDSQIALFRRWLSTHLDRVLIFGAHHKQVRLALKKSRIQCYIAAIDTLGFLEYSLLCKPGTAAPGIIKTLGPYLPGIPLYAFSPKKAHSIISEQLPL